MPLAATLVVLPLLTLVLTLGAHTAALALFPRWNLLDFPERYGLKRSKLPYPTGVLTVALFLAVYAAAEGWSPRSIAMMGAVLLLAGACFIDDRRQLHPLPRLGAQLAAALLVVLTGDCVGGQICSVTNPLESVAGGAVLDLHGTSPLLAIAVTAGWLIVTTNALNWFDGVPGQTHTISAIGFTTIGLLSLSDRVGQPELALLSFVLAALALGALPFDFPPARTVPGDTGAMFFGFMLGVLTIYAGGKIATGFLALGVPLLDSIFVVVRRIRAGVSPLRGSARGEHLHHRLLAAGWSARTIIACNAAFGGTFGVMALFLSTSGKALAGLALLGMLLLLSASLRDERISDPRT